jgi:Cu/Ag efflux pump CusA
MNLTFRGVQLNRFQTKEREIPMIISLDPEDKVGIYNLRNLLVGMQDDKEITLGSVATFNETRGPNRIYRQDQRTMVSVQGLFEGEEWNTRLVTTGRTARKCNGGIGDDPKWAPTRCSPSSACICSWPRSSNHYCTLSL